jgi:hypothetical protein
MEREALQMCLEYIETNAHERKHVRHAIQAALAQPAQEPVAFDLFLESQDFYELMQTYRHCPIDAHIPFETVKDALRSAHIGAKP